jgi:Copper amine oxidase N-terminal domain
LQNNNFNRLDNCCFCFEHDFYNPTAPEANKPFDSKANKHILHLEAEMKSKKINSKKVFYTLAILFVLTIIIIMVVIMCPNSSKNIEGELVLADMNPIVYDQSSHTIEGTIPPGATLKIGEEIIETSGEFQHTLELDKSPSLTTKIVQMLDKKGNVIQEEKVTVENVRNMNVWIQIDNPEMMVDGKVVMLDVPATNIDGSILLPLRVIGDAFDTKVDWAVQSKNITVLWKNKQVDLQINNKTAKINGEAFELDTPAQMLDDRTMVPIRFVAEAFGAEVKWSKEDASVTITQEIHP